MSHVDDGALHAYLDGELSPVERERLEAHLAACPVCRTRLDEERGLVERASQLLGLAQPPQRTAPPPLHQLRQPRLMWRLRMPLAWAATAVLAIGFGYFLGDRTYRRGGRGLGAEVPGDSSALAPAVALMERNASPVPARAPTRRPAAQPTTDELAAREEHLADRAVAAQARVDSMAPAASAGVVAPQPQVQVRGAQALARAPAEISRAAARDQPVAREWPIIERAPARALLGADPVGVPGLRIVELRRSPAGDGVVLVEQQVDSTTVIQLFQRRVEAQRQAARDAAPAAKAPAMQREVTGYYAGTERLGRFIGALRVEIAGPLPADSLSQLLERVKPIP